MKSLVIVGASGFGREVRKYVRDINIDEPTWEFLGFVDDGLQGKTPEGDTILGNLDYLLNMNPRPFFCVAIANSKVRQKLAEKLEKNGFLPATIIHPSAKIGPNVIIGKGSIICMQCILTTNPRIGDYCIFNNNCSCGHDTVLGDYVSIMSDTVLAGDDNVGDHCYFGLHCTVINQLNLVGGCTFGAGSVVVKNITEPGTYVGVPAKKINR